MPLERVPILFFKHPQTDIMMYFVVQLLDDIPYSLEVRPTNPRCNSFVAAHLYGTDIQNDPITAHYSVYDNYDSVTLRPGQIVEENIKHKRYLRVSYSSDEGTLFYVACYVHDAKLNNILPRLQETIDKYKFGEYMFAMNSEPDVFLSSERYYRVTVDNDNEEGFANNPNVLALYQNIFPLKVSMNGELLYDTEFRDVETCYYGQSRISLRRFSPRQRYGYIDFQQTSDKFVLSFRLAVLQAFGETYLKTVFLYMFRGTRLPYNVVVKIVETLLCHRVRTLPFELPTKEYFRGRLTVHDFVHYPYRFSSDGRVMTDPFQRFHPVSFVGAKQPYLPVAKPRSLLHENENTCGCWMTMPVIQDRDLQRVVNNTFSGRSSLRCIEDPCKCLVENPDPLSDAEDRRSPSEDERNTQRRRLDPPEVIDLTV